MLCPAITQRHMEGRVEALRAALRRRRLLFRLSARPTLHTPQALLCLLFLQWNHNALLAGPPAISERPIDSTEISEVPAVPSGHIGQRPCTGLHGRRPSVKNSQRTRHDSSSAPQAAVSRAAGGRAPRSQTAWKLNRSLKRLLTTGPSFRFFQPKAERNTSPFRKPLPLYEKVLPRGSWNLLLPQNPSAACFRCVALSFLPRVLL